MKKLFAFLMTIFVTFSNALTAASQATYPIFDAAEDLTSSVRFNELKASKSGQFSENCNH